MPGANHVGIRVADCKFGGEFFPLHLGKKLVDKENYEGNGKYGVMGRTSHYGVYGVDHLTPII